MTYSIHKVTSKSDKKQFINFPHDLYQDDVNYVPELSLSISEVLSEKKNPFFKHSEADLFLAKDENGKIVGRIAAILNNNYNSYYNANSGFFGFFDSVNNQEVANLLLTTAVDWVKNKGVNKIIGPTNFTTNDTAGVLVDGFDSPPVVMMTYNKAYYIELLENFGLTKEMDLFAYNLETSLVSKKSLKVAQLLEERLERNGITIRTMSKKTQKQDILKIKDTYRKAWEKNWGFVPPTDEEFDHLAEGLLLILDRDFVFLAEKDGQVIGFAVIVPNINEITKSFKKGSLFPFNIFKLLLRKSKVKSVRVILLGIEEQYRKIGIAPIFFARTIQTAIDKGVERGEASWILENNQAMVQAADGLNGDKYKTYRLYSKEI